MRRILVVDDEMGARTLLSIMLERDGFKALKAKDASEALTMLEQGERPDLIILDVMMPGMDGVELCRTIRNRPATTEIPILILSARSDVEAVMRGMDAGATDYLPKPILNHDLTAKVRTMLSMDAVLEE
ncbi:MAG: response regulator [Aggregatilineales bacterium]|jgi:DNA-binding response OmpR family regulator